MRWLLEALKGFVSLLSETAATSPRAARGAYIILLFFALIAGGLLLLNPAKFWWAPKVLIWAGVLIGLLLLVGFFALAAEIAKGSGQMGGRTGVMLSDLDQSPPDDPKRKKKPTVRRQGDTVPEWKVRAKVAAAEAILDFLEETDPAFACAQLVKCIEGMSERVRAAMEAGSLLRVAKWMTADCLQAVRVKLDEPADTQQIEVDEVIVSNARMILVDLPGDPDQCRVTALITFRLLHKSRNEVAVNQQFWTFRRDGSRWKVDRILPAEEADDVCSRLSQLPARHYERFQKTASAQVLAEVADYAEE